MNKKGFLIVVDGLDGSGKSTQVKLLGSRLADAGYNVRQIEFPTYTKSSALIEMYLHGEFGNKPEDVSGYAASVFYTVDRYASFKKDWGEDYNSGSVILTGRYTTSNAIHQCSKLPREKWNEYLKWLEEFEYGIMGLPKPDAVIFLDMPPEYSEQLLNVRYNSDDGKKDIHEKDKDYLKRCYETAYAAAPKLNWTMVSCIKDGKIKNINELNDEIFEMLKAVLENR
ncbi:MAG: deoxynucleoside kinase [Bacillota bacterium]|nr:deoxynucleoside kinase [Bacillota bacterium]